MDPRAARKQVFINYYTADDYEQVLEALPEIVKQADRKSMEVMEPTIEERKVVRNFIKDFIRKKNRKVYGGTAVNELIKNKNPKDAIYDEYSAKDIEFYSFTPVPDMVELCNDLYQSGYKFVQGKEAQHEETYTIFVNFQLYCDISYVPANVYHGIKTVSIDGINYTDPHFIYIDHLRIYNAPVTAFCFWEKIFKRSYILLKHYPLEYYDKPIKIDKPTDEFNDLFLKIKREFLIQDDIKDNTLLGGFDAYNFYIRQATRTTDAADAPARVSNNNLSEFKTNIPYVELISVNYQESVIALYNFVKEIVPVKESITFEEFFPLFQFTGHSILIKYNDKPLVKVYDADGLCVPIVKLKMGIKYISYQYTLMMFFMHKFKCHLDKNKEMYLNYGNTISNLIKTRNTFLEQNKLLIINDTIFSEFRISCTGATMSSSRTAILRRIKYNKPLFIYKPDDFFKKTEEDQKKFDPGRHKFKNRSGNIIRKPEHMRFKLDESDLIVNEKIILSDTASDLDTESINVDSDTETVKSDTEINLKTETENVVEI